MSTNLSDWTIFKVAL